MTQQQDAAAPAACAGNRPAVVNRGQLAAELGVEPWMITRGQELGVVPERTTPKGWTRQVADDLAGRVDELREAIADAESLGARRIAEEILAPVTGLPVAAADVPVLASRGALRTLGEYGGHALFSVRDARDLTDSGRLELADIIAERAEREAAAEREWRAWCEESLPPAEAATRLGWRRAELDKIAAAGRITAGRGGRYPLRALDELAADEELADQVIGDRLVGTQEAAGLLELRPADFKLVLEAGWLAPAAHTEVRVGRRRWIDVPLYRARDIDAVRDIPGIDWEAVREVPAGRPSLLRQFVVPTVDRGPAIRDFAAALADRHRVDVWAYFDDRTGIWELEWTRNQHGAPTEHDVAAALHADRAAGRYRDDIRLSGTRWGARTLWAKPMTAPGAAVVLCTTAAADTMPTSDREPSAGPSAQQHEPGAHESQEVPVETLAEALVEIAVIDASTGVVLLDTAVRATGAPSPVPGRVLEPVARREQPRAKRAGAVDEPRRAREWARVLPQLRALTRSRLIIPGDPGGDPARIAAATARSGKRLMHLADPGTWALAPGDRPLAIRTDRLPACEAAAHVHEKLHRLAAGRGHHYPPPSAHPSGTDRADQLP